jgi:hypothetical protein
MARCDARLVQAGVVLPAALSFGSSCSDREGLAIDQALERRDKRPHESQPSAGSSVDRRDVDLADQRCPISAGGLHPVREQNAHRARRLPVEERGGLVQAGVVTPQGPDASAQTRQGRALGFLEEHEGVGAGTGRGRSGQRAVRGCASAPDVRGPDSRPMPRCPLRSTAPLGPRRPRAGGRCASSDRGASASDLGWRRWSRPGGDDVWERKVSQIKDTRAGSPVRSSVMGRR